MLRIMLDELDWFEVVVFLSTVTTFEAADRVTVEEVDVVVEDSAAVFVTEAGTSKEGGRGASGMAACVV